MRFQVLKISVLLACFFVFSHSADAQEFERSQEIDEKLNIPVLVKHLPDWESKSDSAQFFSDKEQFYSFFAQRRIISDLDFIPGTEAVYAEYPEGKLVIVEYSTPQASSAVDKEILAAGNPGNEQFVYRRIGNYNVFLFDGSDAEASAALLEKINYEKVVTWPYGNPKRFFAREREFIVGTTSLFLSTVVFILSGVGIAIILGGIVGILYFRANDRRRAAMTAFSDAGGLTRLNLDGLSQEMTQEKLLSD